MLLAIFILHVLFLYVSMESFLNDPSQSVKAPTFKRSLDRDEISDDTSDDTTEDVVKLMQERLPSYIVNCFVASGFDSTEAIFA